MGIYVLLSIVCSGIFFSGVRIVRPTHRGLIERLGKYHRFANPGFHWVIPVIENMYMVNITEQMIDAEPQEIITNDNLNAQVDAQVYFKVKSDEESVKNSQYNVNVYKYQIVNLARTILRNIIGTLTLKSANSEHGKINSELHKTLHEETTTWGIEIVRTELKQIDPPKDVQTPEHEDSTTPIALSPPPVGSSMCNEKEIIGHLSKEIETQTNNMMMYRCKINFTLYLGPYLLLGAYLVATKKLPSISLENLGIEGVRSAGILGICFLVLGIMSAVIEYHSWEKCNQWREAIGDIALGKGGHVEKKVFNFPHMMILPYIIVYGTILVTFLETVSLLLRMGLLTS